MGETSEEFYKFITTNVIVTASIPVKSNAPNSGLYRTHARANTNKNINEPRTSAIINTANPRIYPNRTPIKGIHEISEIIGEKNR